MVIWHNPRCSKSRATLELLREQGVEPVVRHYLEDPPGAEEIHAALHALGVAAQALVRQGEAEYRALELKAASEDTLIAAMAAHPGLIERPVVFSGARAAIGRPPEAVLDIL